MLADGEITRSAMARSRRVVVKVGTAVVTRPDGRLALGRMASLVEQIQALRDAGRQVLLVTSGAVGLGADRLGFERPPKSVVDRQACAAAGQSSLMAFYDGLFGRLGARVAQVLLTEGDFHERHRYVHLAATLNRLLDLGVVPVINENDTVSTAEIALVGAKVFGDNDRLAALVAAGMGADLLVLLTDVDGVYDRPPSEAGARRIPVLGDESVEIGAASPQGRGGMGSKLASARVAAQSGVQVVVAAGKMPEVLLRVVAGEDVGTWVPAEAALSGRKRWLAFATAPAGRLVVNEGARASLVERKTSLLLPGVVSVEGTFVSGAVVSIVDAHGREFARGRVARGSEEITRELVDRPAGRGRALVHRDHVVVFEEEE